MVVLVALLAALALAVRTRAIAIAWPLVILSALWLPANRPLEGPPLLVFSATHALTLADLLACLGAAVSLVVLLDHNLRTHPRGHRAAAVTTTVGVWWTVFALGALLAISLD